MSEQTIHCHRHNNISFCGWLFLVLLVLKLTGLADISWGWVFSPFIAVALFVAAFFLIGIIGVNIE